MISILSFRFCQSLSQWALSDKYTVYLTWIFSSNINLFKCIHLQHYYNSPNVLFNDALNTFYLWLYWKHGEELLRKRERKPPAVTLLATLSDYQQRLELFLVPASPPPLV